MPYTPNTTWVDGSGGSTPTSAARFNNMEAGLALGVVGPNQGRVRVTKSAVQSIASATNNLTIVWDQESYDTNTMHDNVTNNSRLTAPVAGVYFVECVLCWAANATGTRSVQLRHSSTARFAGVSVPAQATVPTSIQTSVMYPMNAAEYFEVEPFQNSGGALNVGVSDATTGIITAFSMTLVGSL